MSLMNCVPIRGKSVLKMYSASGKYLVSILVLLCALSTASQAAIRSDVHGMVDPLDRINWFEMHRQALESAPPDGDLLSVYQKVGRAYYQTGNTIIAGNLLRSALGLSQQLAVGPRQLAQLHNDLGLVAIARSDLEKALGYFEEAARLGASVQASELQFVSGINVARTLLGLGRSSALDGHLEAAALLLDRLPDGAGRAAYELELGELYQRGVKGGALKGEARLEALANFQNALSMAENAGDDLLRSRALGNLGALYEDERQWAAALTYTRQAIFAAQLQANDLLLYRWQWQLARLQRASGEMEGAIASYRDAVATLTRARPQLLSAVTVNHRQEVSPVYYELADLLLDDKGSASSSTVASGDQAILREVIDVLEAAKLAEVEDYFDSDCVLLPENRIQLSAVIADSAVIYPIFLQERTEILVQTGTGIRQFTTLVSAADMRNEIHRFRTTIESVSYQQNYLEPAQQLYRWLVAPAEALLASEEIKTLVVVPDGPLRSVPVSALHDGEGFLIERFAIATTPGITLTDPQPLNRDEIKVLAGGLTEAVQGYVALPAVEGELREISDLYAAKVLADDKYVLDAVSRELAGGEYQIVHFATHGEFSSDHTQSFLLTYDDRLNMSTLENIVGLRRFQSEPLELLVLSACQTAVGDDRAALGLAGIALKAGARSALATLWLVNDEATGKLVGDFYTQLRDPGTSKAQALRAAQLNLIRETGYRHPSYWAPFLMIGNWL